MPIQIQVTIIGDTPEENVIEVVDATQSSERCEGCGRGAEVFSFEEPMVEPEAGPAHLCLRCINGFADYQVIGQSIRCDWDLCQPIQPANPEVGRCFSCEVDGLIVYRFQAKNPRGGEETRELAVCRQCFHGGWAMGYSLVVE